MPTFSYRAYNSGGKSVAGHIDAAGKNDAARLLRDTGLYPVAVEKAGGERRLFSREKVSARQLSLATRQLATLLSSGTPLSEALAVLSANTAERKLKTVFARLNESVTGGSSLARALEQYQDVFSPFYRGLVTAGEASGSLDKVLPRLADYLEARAKLSSDVRAALTYPALMTFVGAGVLAFLFIFVIPRITRIFEDTGSALPLVTVVLMWASGLVSRWWPAAVAALAALAWGASRNLKTPRGKAALDRLVPMVPVVGSLSVCFHVATLTRTLGSLLKGGVQMLGAIDITREVVSNAVYDKILRDAREECMGGASLSSSLARHKAVPPIVVHMISVGERSGNLDEMLLKTADAYDMEFNAGVKRAMNLLEPLLILAMGLIVGFMVLAILLPIFELNQVVR